MQPFSKPITEIIKERYSCRSYLTKPISENHRWLLESYIASACCQAPLGTHPRFGLIAAVEGDSSKLRGLGTYGFIRNPTCFLVGATVLEGKSLEDFGYVTESIILYATDLSLGTCWLGGSFTRSTFIERFPIAPGEIMPAVIASGYPVEGSRSTDILRQQVGSDERFPWSQLYYHETFQRLLTQEEAGEFTVPLEMVRLAPSASNKQPWRLVKAGNFWHFFLQRTPGYGSTPRPYRDWRIADLQRIDMGIAMCHFELTARQLGFQGKWEICEPGIDRVDEFCEYVISWILG